MADVKSAVVAFRHSEGNPLKLLIHSAAVMLSLSGAAFADITVSSKIDTEGGLIGNMIADTLEAGGLPVTRNLQLGATQVVRQAILSDQIDIYPEYTGNAAFFFNEADAPVWNDAAAGYEQARTLDAEANDIVWLTPAPANNTWAIAVTGEMAAANDLATMSDFGEFVAGGGDVKLAASTEFVSSPAVLPAMQEAYGFELSPEQLIILSGGDTAATIAAAARGTSGANAAMVYGTDGGVAATGLVVMTDDEGVQPVYAPTAIVRQAVLDEYPQIDELLKPVFESLDLETLQALNGRIQVGGEPSGAVARSHLQSIGILD